MKKQVIILVFALIALANHGIGQYEEMSPLANAKMYFSDKPFTDNHDGSKTSFKSSNFIYGRIELENQTLFDAFKMIPAFLLKSVLFK